jgi:glycosyltransferase involved in cell wall biosynthesis
MADNLNFGKAEREYRLVLSGNMLRKIKIAQVRWGEPIGGPERVLRDLAVYLNRGQFDMRFFFLARGGPYEDEIRQMGYPLSVIPARSACNLSLRLALIRRLRDFGPDLVHEHGVPPFVRPVIKWATRAPLLSFDHGEIKINRRKGKSWLNWLNGFEYRLFSERIIVNSDANKGWVTTTHRVAPNRVQVIRLGLDLEAFQSLSSSISTLTTPDLILGYVGRIQNYDKGTDFLPKLVQELKDRGLADFKLRIVGDGPDLGSLQKCARELGVADHIEFLGRRQDVPELMVGMDILLVPSRTEAFGLVAVEALAVGTRVVAFAVDGLSQLLADCPGACLVRPGDVQAMSEAVMDVWKRCGKQRSPEAQRYVAEHYNACRMTREIEELYRQILDGSKL